MSIRQDFRYGLRAIRRSPGITASALLALALGIGANTTLFSVVNGVLFRPLNYPEPDRLVELTRHFIDQDSSAVSATKFDFWQKENHSFSSMAAYGVLPVGLNLSGIAEPERIRSLGVTADFFKTLGTQPFLGRAFRADEDTPGAGHFVVIGFDLWGRLLHSDPNAVGGKLLLNGVPYTILGVMRQGFEFSPSAEAWTPMQLKPDPADMANAYQVIGRLKPGVTPALAQSDLKLVSDRFRQKYSKNLMDSQESIGYHPYSEWMVGNVRPALLMLMGAVGLVLLIACANVANLLLARSAARQREIALRVALGANAWRIVRQLVIESLLLSSGGVALGIALAFAGLPLLLRMAPADLPRVNDIGIEWRVLLFATVAGFFTGLLFSLAPAWQSLRSQLGNAIRGSGSRSATAGPNLLRHGLVIAEVAISLILLVGSGLLIATFAKLRGVQPGFDPHNVLTAQMSLSDERFQTTASVTRLTTQVVQSLDRTPGILAAANVTALPLELGPDLPFEIDGRPTKPEEMPDEQWRAISPDYFAVMRVPLLAGRTFTDRDNENGPPTAIINEALAKKYFPKQNPIGQRIMVGRVMGPAFADHMREIVGIAGDTRESQLSKPAEPILFVPQAQEPDGMTKLGNTLLPLQWVIRVAGDPMQHALEVRREVASVSGGVPIADPRPLEQVMSASISRQRFSMLLLTVFAGIALALGGIGLYGVISYSVTQRLREMGIRGALGATRTNLLQMVIRQGMTLTGIGLLLGLCGSAGLVRFLQSTLYGVEAYDPKVVTTVCAMLLCVGLMACYVPARRAAGVDPAVALRDE